jgi:hypothetical protein
MSIFSSWTWILFRRRRQRQQKKYQLRIILPCKRGHYRDYDLMIFIQCASSRIITFCSINLVGFINNSDDEKIGKSQGISHMNEDRNKLTIMIVVYNISVIILDFLENMALLIRI